jgi:hypothetical protein
LGKIFIKKRNCTTSTLELIFLSFFSDSDRILVNEQVGHMLRTKVSSANEGGVAAGFGALDSVYLVDYSDEQQQLNGALTTNHVSKY